MHRLTWQLLANVAGVIVAAMVVTLIVGCTAATRSTLGTIGQAGESPGMIACKGKTTIAIIGAAGPASGINGSITADCGTDGAWIRWGPPDQTQ